MCKTVTIFATYFTSQSNILRMSFQAYLDNIKTKTGKTPEDFKKLAQQKGLLQPLAKAGEIVAWLKQDFDLGHGHAMAVYAVFKNHKAATPVKNVAKKETLSFPVKLAAPAQRALAAAGINTLKQLSKLTEAELSLLHGIGPNALVELKKAMEENGLSFSLKK